MLQKKFEEKKEEINKNFVNFIDNLKILTSEINNLISEGYFSDFKLEIELKKEQISIKIENPFKKNFNDIFSLIKTLKKEKESLKQSQKNAYEKFPILRLIFGRQFRFLIKHIRFGIGKH